jgi:23S rRNA (adenine2503-C2)-methyltransferase
MKVIDVPTGKILIVDGSLGRLECLSIGDYGKEKNIKADFLGLSDEIEGVPNGDIMPLTHKWVVTILTQYGCSMGCTFCDVPKVGPGRNATLYDLFLQVEMALSQYPKVFHTDRLNVHYARMGEPTFNHNVITHALHLKQSVRHKLHDSLVHPVVSTMMPKRNDDLLWFLQRWTYEVKNDIYRGDAGLQISINSTNEIQREEMFHGNSRDLFFISKMCDHLPYPKGRKYALNFALADSYEIDAKKLVDLFNPKKFMCKITPMHLTKSCVDKGIETSNGYMQFTPYKKVEEELKAVGFDVLVFIPSLEEDQSRITCGNAILSNKDLS